MRSKRIIICLLLFLAFVCLSAFGSFTETLSGTYSANIYGVTTSYDFTKESVTVRFSIGGYELAGYEGTYTLSDDETQITLSFDLEQIPNGASLPAGLTSLGGTFAFQKCEGYIMIGQVRYDQVKQDTETVGQASSISEPANSQSSKIDEVNPLRLQLDLPEEYFIQYAIHDEYAWSHDYTQTMIKSDSGYYFDFGDTGERYIFLRRDSGKYLQYKYDLALEKYIPTMLTPDIQSLIDSGVMTEDMVSLDANVVSGFAARITTNFDLYKTFGNNLKYIGEETVSGIVCQEFTASSDKAWGKQQATVWVSPKTGICMKADYQYQSPDGTVGSRQIECLQWKTTGIELPALS